MTVLPADWEKAGSAGLTLKRTAEDLVHLYQTGTEIDIVPPRLYSSISSLEHHRPRRCRGRVDHRSHRR